MTPKRFKIEQAGELADFLQEEIREAAERALLATAMRVVAEIVNVVIPAQPRQPVDRGAYRAGWHARKTDGGALITNSLPYASIIEFGARAENIKIGRKMIEALTAWILRKGLVKKGGSDDASKKKATDEATAMAWAIAKAMKKRGIFNPPSPPPRRGLGGVVQRLFGSKPKGGLRVLEQAMEKADEFFEAELRRELGR